LELDVKAVLEGLESMGDEGWISVELDRPIPHGRQLRQHK